ncbi:MAG: N-acetyltransferase [Actinobacteria bacterium]|nr:N-acetyltransferase [Actinomycetota bacterium]
MELRLASIDDAEAIRAIYNHEVLTTTAVFDIEPRSLADQRAWRAARSGAHAVVVAEVAGTVAGFASLSPYRPRPAYTTTVEDSVYVHAGHRGAGVGGALLDRLLEVATLHGFHSVIGRIGGGNEGSIALHRSRGFALVGVEREVGRKFGRWLDVHVVQLLLPA